jgi:uncharacterized cupin superfamily protein
VGITHVDDVEKRRLERGQTAGTWSNLGTAAGSYRCGVHRIELAPGEMPTPAHVHGESEEIFYVLAGSRWTGLRHYELKPGALSAPPHAHSAEEEIFVVLDGEGTLELTPSPRGAAEFADQPETHAVRRGSVVARPPGSGVAHTFRGDDAGLTLLAWGTREPNDVCWYPRSRKLFWRGVGVIGRVETLDSWDGEELE